MALATLTPEQRDAALAKAREARGARSSLLAGIASGEDTVPAVLARAESDPAARKDEGHPAGEGAARLRPRQDQCPTGGGGHCSGPAGGRAR